MMYISPAVVRGKNQEGEADSASTAKKQTFFRFATGAKYIIRLASLVVLVPLDDIFVDAMDDDEATLEAADGSYRQVLQVGRDGQKQPDGYVRLAFPGVRPGKEYTLLYDTKEDADSLEVAKPVILSRVIESDDLEKPLRLDRPFAVTPADFAEEEELVAPPWTLGAEDEEANGGPD